MNRKRKNNIRRLHKRKTFERSVESTEEILAAKNAEKKKDENKQNGRWKNIFFGGFSKKILDSVCFVAKKFFRSKAIIKYGIPVLIYILCLEVIFIFILYMAVNDPVNAVGLAINVLASFLFIPVNIVFFSIIEKIREKNDIEKTPAKYLRYKWLLKKIEDLAKVLNTLNVKEKSDPQILLLKQTWESFEVAILDASDDLDPGVIKELLIPFLYGKKSSLSSYLEQTDEQILNQWRNNGVSMLEKLASRLKT